MQIGTAQHLISHLSVKVPSVGSPGGPQTDVTASARQKHASEAVGRRGEGSREVKLLTSVCWARKGGKEINF